MSYEGNDLGYDLGYDSEPIRPSEQTIQQAYSPEGPQVTYLMAPKMPPIVTPGGAPPKKPDDKKPDDKKPDDKKAGDKKPSDKKKTPRPRRRRTQTSVKLGLDRGEIKYKTDGYLFTDQLLLENATPAKTETLGHLKSEGINNEKLQKTIVELAFSKTKGSDAAQKKKKEEIKGKKGDEIKKDAHVANAQRYADYYRKLGVDPEVAKENMVARGIIDEKTEFPKSWPKSKAKPALAADKIVPPHGGTSKEADQALVRTHGQFDALPEVGKKTSKTEVNAIIKQDTERVKIREQWVDAALKEGKVDNREEGYKLFYQAVPSEDGKKKEEFDPDKAKAALFKDNKPVMPKGTSITPAEFAAYLKNPAAFLANLSQSDLKPEAKKEKKESIEAFDKYMKMSPQERADFKKTNPVTAAQFETQAQGVQQNEMMGLLTDSPPKGMKVSENEAKGLLSSDAFGDPPLYDSSGRLKTAKELDMTQEEYDAHVGKVKQNLISKRKKIYGDVYSFDEKGEPIQSTTTDPNDPDKKVPAFKDGEPIYETKKGLSEKEIQDATGLAASRRGRWLRENRQKATAYHRDRLIQQLDRLGISDKKDNANIAIWMHHHGFYDDDANVGQMARMADEMEKIPGEKGKPTQEMKDKKIEILRYNEGKTAPTGEDHQKHVSATAALNPKAKGKGGGAKGQASSAERTESREDQQAHDRQIKKEDREHAKEMSAIQFENQKAMEKLKEEAQIRAEKRKEQMDIKADKRRAGYQLFQSFAQNLMQGMQAGLQSILQEGAQNREAMRRGTQAGIQQMYATQSAILSKWYGPGQGRRG